ncbi:MAG: hypothetical protein IKK03_12360 [Lachnospiraceae bacterium]|nr:hypothetical protein [Lachnospiraceae bacterium]
MTSIKKDSLRRIMHIVVILYGLACLWLFYHQSVADLSVEGAIPYQSDLPLHISMIVEDGWYYSFTAYAYKVLHVLAGGTTVGIALMLAVISVATIYVTERAICYLSEEKEMGWKTLLLALCTNLVMPIYVEYAGVYRYVSYQVPNIWHNSTYICMKLFALMTFLYYFKLEKKYCDGITVKEWLVFAILNVITTGIKPSFLLAFSPIMGIFLLVDLFKRMSFKRILIFGSALLPSGAVVLWQNAVLFGSDTGNGMTINPWYTFSLHADRPKLAVLLSVAFCGVVILMTLKNVFKDKKYLFTILMVVLGFLEALCLVESGKRSVDGNFLWGYSFCLFVLFLYTTIQWLRYPRKTMVQKAIYAGMTLVYGAHLYCGVLFFVRLVCGESYWMKW